MRIVATTTRGVGRTCERAYETTASSLLPHRATKRQSSKVGPQVLEEAGAMASESGERRRGGERREGVVRQHRMGGCG